MKRFALPLLALAGLSIGTLASGSGLAEHLLPGGLPLGNLLMATALSALSGAAWALSPCGSARRRFAGLSLAASLLWLPASALLAGNLALNFSGTRGAAWLAGSVAVMVAVLIALAWAMAGFAFDRLRQP
ncbi:MAG: hypothetical protein K0M64_05320 [Rhizobium sp.]|nr:hypothetical protein [Rhizobium sp.]